MAIKYYLRPNISNNPGSYVARVQPNKTHDMKSITNCMLQKGSSVQEADIIAVLHLFFETLTEEVASGNQVMLPLIKLKPGITGVFNGPEDQFDITRQKCKTILSQLSRLRKVPFDIVEKIDKPVPAPVLLLFTNCNTSDQDSVLTPNGVGQLRGQDLKFDKLNPPKGFFS